MSSRLSMGLLCGWLFVLSFAPPLALGSELSPLLQAAARYDAVTIDRVLAVDTLLVDGKRVVLLGIAGPRPPRVHYAQRDEHGFIIKENDPVIAFEDEAYRYARSLAEGKTVRLEFDVERRDGDGSLLAYVYFPDGRMLNTELLRMGYAKLHLTSPNVKYAEKFRAAYQESRREMRGLQGGW